ncbi:dNTP triphosphohydrolase [Candidatus Peregrinibacteria bacterium]|nr:dNTP triphosphohydrolase [Candidatus Peregrinibacteria bacterium]
MQKEKFLFDSATPARGILGRIIEEPDDIFRLPFQRDRDRIISTQAFRRLQGKTQVFVTGQDDHYRTRLTHTLDVAGISRNLARFLGLNEDLCECIALAHDLGHPPFGHMGESALNTWMRRYGGHFEHNEQSLRIVTVLETHSSEYPGLNLNREILLGLQKHTGHPLSLEAQIVNLADEIAYIAHDCEDGMDQKLFSIEDLTTIPLLRDLHESRARRGTSLRGAIITHCIDDLCSSSTKDTIIFSTPLRASLDMIRAFFWEHLYDNPVVKTKTQEGAMLITKLCEWFMETPSPKIHALEERSESTRLEAVKDFVAGMTDAYARSVADRFSAVE